MKAEVRQRRDKTVVLDLCREELEPIVYTTPKKLLLCRALTGAESALCRPLQARFRPAGGGDAYIGRGVGGSATPQAPNTVRMVPCAGWHFHFG